MARGKEQQITFLNQKLEDEVDIRPSESIWVDGAGGDKIQVFIVKPHNFDASKKYPLIINVHGGPQMQWIEFLPWRLAGLSCCRLCGGLS